MVQRTYYPPLMSELPRNVVPPISLTLPKPIAPARYRQPKKNIPQTPEERTQIQIGRASCRERV